MNYDETLKAIKALIKVGNLTQALALALECRKVYPHEAKPHQLIGSIKVQMVKQEEKARKAFIQKGFQIIKSLCKEENFEDALNACNELMEVDPHSRKVKRWHKRLSIDVIEKKLRSPLQQQLDQNHDYEKLYLFYQKLRSVFPEYQKLNKLIQKTEKKIMEMDKERKKLKQLFEEKKYEQVIRGGEELLAFTHFDSKETEKLIKRARRANEKEIEAQSLELILKDQAQLKQAYANKTERLIKL